MAVGWQTLAHIEGMIGQGIMEESATQNYPLGRLLHLDDGRKFRYCKAGASALTAGKTVGSPLSAAERDTSVNGGAVVAIGATSFTFTAVGTITANQFAEGFAHIVNDTGEGLQYKIKSNTAAGAAAETTITLYDPIVTALAATTDVVLTNSLHTGLIPVTDELIYIVGVPTIPVTALYYCWIQSGGLGMVLVNGSTGAGTKEHDWFADAAGGIDGAALGTADGGDGFQKIGGHAFDSEDAVDTEYWPIMLSID